MPTRKPNGEMVAVHWLREVLAGSDLLADVATSLPAIQRWSNQVFVQAHVATGQVVPNFPERVPIIQVDVFSMTGKWNEVFSVAEDIRDATFYGKGLGVANVRSGFYPVNIGDVSIFGEPRPIRDDSTGLSRITLDLRFVYVMVGDYENDEGM